jgi:spore germination protein GerM
LSDENGNILASGPATTDSEWMTEDFIPFYAELNFATPNMKNGHIILRKNNPSDLRENDKQLKIPIVFKQETMTVKIFLCNSIHDPGFSGNQVFASERQIPKTQAVARAALKELLNGVTEEEKSQGFFSNINPGVKIQKISIEDGIARVDFNEQLEFQVAGSARVGAIRAQIIQTLKQFPTINEVVISINGKTDDILQP